MLKILWKIFLIIIFLILILLLAAYFKFFHDIEILAPHTQIWCSEDYQCKYSEHHDACWNVEYTNFKWFEPFILDNPPCQCSFYICNKK